MGKTALILFIILATIIFIVFVAGLFIFIFNYRKRILMHENEKQLLALNSILKGQEEERSRMAKDLHDGVGSMLSSIKLNLSFLTGNLSLSTNDSFLFNKSLQQLDTAIAEMRRVAHNMMPEALLQLGLRDALQDFCDDINASKKVFVKFTVIGNIDLADKNMEVVLYRIVQELTNNALKHAEAKNILIQINRHSRGITVVVEDDGKGFVPELTRKGAGLTNIESRIKFLKGAYDIQSDIGNGASITAEIPL